MPKYRGRDANRDTPRNANQSDDTNATPAPDSTRNPNPIRSMDSTTSPPTTIVLQECSAEIRSTGATSQNLYWHFSCTLASSNTEVGPTPGPASYAYFIHNDRRTMFLPPMYFLKPEQNFYMRIWPDGRVAAGFFVTYTGSVVAFVFGTQRCPVTVIPDPVAVARRETTSDVPQISFAYYGIAYGEISNDGRPFAMWVFKDIGEDSRWFPPI
ncbi:Structural maintenance of chromosomes protein 4 [Elsinoe australis]|uniref:Structural maintenance of chromosomes protein 4 n=1 Tax=Elsinoe australis TaxID=40998 RepID=A0A2P8A693_9PEZI|nr:Structural maintenance of chromosomes protein 4 [Elsinoe australis]